MLTVIVATAAGSLLAGWLSHHVVFNEQIKAGRPIVQARRMKAMQDEAQRRFNDLGSDDR